MTVDELFERYWEQFLRLARKYETNQIPKEDIVQHAWVLCRKKSQFEYKSENQMFSYMKTNLYRAAVDLYREDYGRNTKSNHPSKATSLADDMATELVVNPDGLSCLLDRERLERLEKAVRQLSEIDQTIVRLKSKGLTLEEIAKSLELATATVQRRLKKAIQQLADSMRDLKGGDDESDNGERS